MKLVALIDCSNDNFKKIIEMSKHHKSVFLDTEHCDESHEYKYLLDSIKHLRSSDEEIVVAKYSGREMISKDLGDECPEMIVSFSTNKNSKNYIDCPVDIFINILNLLEKETE